MKPTKYIIMLFLSLYASACLSAPFTTLTDLPLARIQIYGLLTVPIYALLLAGDALLNRICSLQGADSWISIYDRPLREEQRIYGLDVIRFFAIISVPAIHFIGLTGYYNAPLDSPKMFAATCVRWLFICCVPLFLTITGYFKHNKYISADHYKSIFALLATHVFISCIRIGVDFKYHGVTPSIKYIVDKLIYFEYGWYIKLYIGIMLLIPFFNLIWKHLETKENRELLIITLIFLCSMGPLVYNIQPTGWTILYVFIYYFMGAYLCQYEVYINKVLNLALIVIMLVLTAIGNHTNTLNGVFNWDFAAYGSNSGYSSLPAVVLTFLIMTFLIDADTGIRPLRGFFYSFAVVSLEMYMFSQMFDSIIYPKLPFRSFTEAFPYMPLVVGGIVLLSYIASQIKRLIFYLVSLPFRFLGR